MKVKLSTQVLSHSVAAAISTYVMFQALPLSTTCTALLLEKFDKIFDCCNASSFKDPKSCRRPIISTSHHIQEATDALSSIKSMKVLNAITNENCGHSDNPMPIQFIRAYGKLFHTNLLRVVAGDFEDGKNNLLLTMENLEENNKTLSNITSPPSIVVNSNDYMNEDFQKKNC